MDYELASQLESLMYLIIGVAITIGVLFCAVLVVEIAESISAIKENKALTRYYELAYNEKLKKVR